MEIFIGILGIIVSVSPSLIAWYKDRKPKIIFVIEEEINLYNEINKSVEGLEVLYKGEKVIENTYLLKAFFLYLGSEDINKSKISKPLYLEIPKSSEWFSYNIIQTSRDFDVTNDLVDNKLYFRFDLLKDRDYVYFQCFVHNLENKTRTFTPSHRIEKIKDVETIVKSTLVNNSFIFTNLLLLPIMALFMYSTFFFDYYSKLHSLNSELVTLKYYNKEKLPINIDSITRDISTKQAVISYYYNTIKTDTTVEKDANFEKNVKPFNLYVNKYLQMDTKSEEIFRDSVLNNMTLKEFFQTKSSKNI